MFETRRTRLAREKEEAEIRAVNQRAREALVNTPRIGTSGLSDEQFGRASSLLAARTILGDITTEELLDAADFIDSGTRYDEDGDEIERPEDVVFDESVDYFRRLSEAGFPTAEFKAREAALVEKVRQRQQQYGSAFERILQRVRDLDPNHYTIDLPEKTGKTAVADEALREYAAESARNVARLWREARERAEARTAERAKRVAETSVEWKDSAPKAEAWDGLQNLDATIHATPHSAPLVPLSQEDRADLEVLRDASQVDWGTEVNGDRWVSAPGADDETEKEDRDVS
jgi:hypothetical protein